MRAIEFKDVSFAYGEGSFQIEKLNFTVEEGEFVAVLGHNGSGKSTLARLCNGLLDADGGEISVFGTPLTGKNLYEVRRNVGVVFQNPDNQTVASIVDLCRRQRYLASHAQPSMIQSPERLRFIASIVEDDVAFGAENVGLPRAEIGERIAFALGAVGMERYRTATVSRLSGGQKQRVAIAGVLALKPKIMILDESTAMLDPRGRKEIVDCVLRLNREEKITVLLITHFPEEALLADRAIVMNRGEIVMEGTPEEIFERHEELLTYHLDLPRIGVICKKLQAGGMTVADTLDEEKLAKEIAECVSSQSI